MSKASPLLLCLALGLSSCATVIKPFSGFALPERTIVLTFDDGPNERSDTTVRILDVLDRQGIRAYFCVIGKQAEKNPEILRRIAAAGHVIVNHSYSHPNPLSLDKGGMLREIELADRAIGEALGVPGYRSEYFRPPYALLTPAIREIAAEYPLKFAGISVFDFFTVDSEYGPKGRRKVVGFYEKAIRRSGGGVIVLHDGCFRPAAVREEDYEDDAKAVNRG